MIYYALTQTYIYADICSTSTITTVYAISCYTCYNKARVYHTDNEMRNVSCTYGPWWRHNKRDVLLITGPLLRESICHGVSPSWKGQ